MVYVYLLVARKGRRLQLSSAYPKQLFCRIQTNILRVNRQVCLEASRILYSKNAIQIPLYFYHHTFQKPRVIRKPNSGGIRTLRSGFEIDTLDDSELISLGGLQRLTRIELKIGVYGVEKKGVVYARGFLIRHLIALINALAKDKEVIRNGNGDLAKSFLLTIEECYRRVMLGREDELEEVIEVALIEKGIIRSLKRLARVRDFSSDLREAANAMLLEE